MKKLVICLSVGLLALGCSSDDGDGDGTGEAGASAAGDASGSGGSSGSGAGSGSSGSGSSGSGGDGSGSSGSGGDGGTSASPMLPGDTSEIPDELLLCNGEVCECADGIDNDGDGDTDGFDVECTGPNDDREDSFWTGISGDNKDPVWQDCFFDGNSGAPTMTDCRYHTECLTGDKTPDDPDCAVTDGCLEFCKPVTPNGCDCFGCCEVTTDGGEVVNVLISSDCNADNIEACDTCVQTDSECRNECGECELCPGKTEADLPDSCFDEPGDAPPPTGGSGGSGGSGAGGTGGEGGGGTPYTCDDNVTVCGSQADCDSGYYCSQGCCLLIAPT